MKTEDTSLWSAKSRFSWPKAIFSASALFVLLWILTVIISSYIEWPPSVYRDAEVFNLTSSEVKWDVFYGEPQKCAQRDCHLLADYPAEKFSKQMVLPAREFPLKDFKKGQMIYARTKIKLPESILHYKGPITFHSTYIFADHYEFFINDRLLDEGKSELMNITIPRSIIGEDGVITVAVKIDPGNLPYQGLAHRGDIVVGPKEKLITTTYLARDIKTTSHLMFLLPKVTICVMFIFFFFMISMRRDTFSFIVYAFLSSLEIFLRSGYTEMVLPWKANWEFVGMHVHNFAFLYLFLFFGHFFRYRSRVISVIGKWSISLNLLFSVLAFTVIPYKLAYSLTDIILAVLHPTIIGFAAYSSYVSYKGAREAQSNTRALLSLFLSVFLGAYTLFMFSESVAIILDLFDLNVRSPFIVSRVFDLAFYFFLSAITALEIGNEISAKQRIKSELDAVEARLELARSVQQLLLPEKFSGKFGTFSYQFFYEPAQQMSGDWANIWQVNDDETRLMIGDVVGKGPQAALAVSAIASVIHSARLENLSMKECIEKINTHLNDLFDKKITSTFSAVVLRKNGPIELFNCGAVGWLVVNGTEIDYLPMRGGPLGVSEKMNVAHKEIPHSPGAYVFSFTDGCLEGARALKNLVRTLKKNPDDYKDFSSMHNLIIQTGKDHVHQDDKTVLMIQAA